MSGLAHKTICFVLTSPFALNAFLLGHLRALADFYVITVCVNTEEYLVSDQLDPRIELLHVPIARGVSLYRDVHALLWLIRLFVRRRFDAVHSITPKGGLLGMIAARLAGIPLRTHTFTGQVWATQRGLVRFFLKALDRILAVCATSLLADSLSQARFLKDEGICSNGAVQVFGEGSIAGVDIEKFSPAAGRRQRVRAVIGLPADASVFVYLGRLNQDKGVTLLATAFARLQASRPDVWMLFVGPDEGSLAPKLLQESGSQAVCIGLTDTPEDYLEAADVLCLPSYREGFGTVIIEAAAMGLPAVASRINGLTDAVVDNCTGLLFPVGEINELYAAMLRMLDSDKRNSLGAEAQCRARKLFSSKVVTSHWLGYYADYFDSRRH
jgi:glycosyltransferase involved in cell wall biosynthesis